jgi:hypothetical protein
MGEPEALKVHLQAFQRIAEPYIMANPDTDLAAVIANRLNRYIRDLNNQ